MIIQLVAYNNELETVGADFEVWDSGGIVFVDFNDDIIPLVTFLEMIQDTDEFELLEIGILSTQECENKENEQKLADKVLKSIQSVCDGKITSF